MLNSTTTAGNAVFHNKLPNFVTLIIQFDHDFSSITLIYSNSNNKGESHEILGSQTGQDNNVGKYYLPTNMTTAICAHFHCHCQLQNNRF